MAENNRDELQEKVQHGNFMMPFAQYVSWLPTSFTSFSMHWHKEIEIIYVETGVCEVNIDLQRYVIRSGDIVIVRPYALHSIKQHGTEEGCIISWVFDVRMLCSGSTDACYTKYLLPLQKGELEYPQVIDHTHEHYMEFYQVLMELHQVCDEKGDILEFNIKWRLAKLFYLLFKYVFCVKKKTVQEKQDALKNIRIVLDYIQENYMNPISVEELSQLVHFSEPYFMRFFKKHTGVTCVEYINEYRLARAPDLLKSTAATIMEVAMQVGIHNVSYFNRIFKKRYGITPKEYRKQVRHTL